MSPRTTRCALVVFFSAISLSFGADFSNQRVSSAPPPSSGCAVPPSATSFLTTDNVVYLYFLATVTASDYITSDWVDPNGSVITGPTWKRLSGRYCFTGARLTITNTPPNRLGSWRVRVFNNASLLFSVSFIISRPDGGTKPPSYEGSFDQVDCSHIYGWAQDKHNLTAVIGVDVTIDGDFLATVPAGDFRSDLSQAGIGNHAFNYYGLPASLKNGQPHSIRVVFAGTDTDLPGSPKQFQNSCGLIGPPNPNPNTWEYALSRYGEDLRNFFVRLEKVFGGGKYQYRMTITGTQWSNNVALDSAILTVVVPRAAAIYKKYSRYHVSRNNAGSIESQWNGVVWSEPPRQFDAAPLKWGMYILGLFNAWGSGIGGFYDLLKESDKYLGPSDWLSGKIDDDEAYSTFRLGAQLLQADMISPSSRIYGVQFIIDRVDETNGQPEFHLTVKDMFGRLLGLEIGLDRNAQHWSARGAPRLSP